MTINPEAAPPIGRVHLDDDLFVPGYLLDMAHSFYVAGYRPAGNTISDGKLSEGLLAFDIIRYYL